MTVDIFFDGACEPKNPGGHMGMGVAVIDENAEILYEKSLAVMLGERGFTETSNNLAEYLSMLLAFDYIEKNLSVGDIATIYGDSQLVCKQMNGEWGMKNGIYMSYAVKANNKKIDLQKKGVTIKIEWTPREGNAVADELSKKALIAKGVKITVRK